MLAVVDTFLIYKIAERRYSNRNIAFIAAILFAVMPMSWLTRRILLDSLFLPLLLTSILFALYTGIRAKQNEPQGNILVKSREDSGSTSENIRGQKRGRRLEQGQGEGYNYSGHTSMSHQNIILLLISGIFLGLTVFTKVPAITFMPLVGFIVFTNNKKDFKALGLWIIPVIMIPLMWPAYAIFNGEVEDWLNGLSWQAAERSDRPIWNSISDLFKLDPVLFAFGILAIAYAGAVKRDSLIILWFVPIVVFFYFVNHSRDIHWIPIIPVFCIAAAVLIVNISNRISSEKVRQITLFAAISAIGIFGLVITAASVTLNLNDTFFEVYAFIVTYLANHSVDYGNDSEDKTIIMGSNWAQIFSWIPKYIFDNDHDFKTFKRFIGSVKEPNLPIKEGEKVLLLVDKNDLERFVLSDSTNINIKQKELYNETKPVAEFKGKAIHYDLSRYPFTTIGENPAIGQGIEIRSNY
jgi:4-amino-4-deoxy-L-arabinose transferase-like glycosyltransferase